MREWSVYSHGHLRRCSEECYQREDLSGIPLHILRELCMGTGIIWVVDNNTWLPYLLLIVSSEKIKAEGLK